MILESSITGRISQQEKSTGQRKKALRFHSALNADWDTCRCWTDRTGETFPLFPSWNLKAVTFVRSWPVGLRLLANRRPETEHRILPDEGTATTSSSEMLSACHLLHRHAWPPCLYTLLFLYKNTPLFPPRLSSRLRFLPHFASNYKRI